MDNKEYVIGIDIGSSNVVMAAGVRNSNGEISVLGVEVQEVDGCVKNGDIINYIELGNAIAKAKMALEQDLGLRLNSSYVSVSGKSVYCVRYEDYVDITNQTGCVTEKELRELHSRIEMVVSGGGDEIVERTPLRYCIDDRQEVKNPLGSYGRKLSATYLFVLISRQQLDMVNRALYRAEIKASGLCVSPTLLPRLLLSETEREEGAVIVDIGSDLTDISVVYNQKLWYFSSLPIGASSINNDMRDFLRIAAKDIDQLKRRYGSAVAASVPENVTVPVKTASQARKQILQRNIAQIIEERLKDIAGFVARELKAAKFVSKVPCGVVLTGGSAYLANIEELFARELNMEVRLGRMLYGLDDDSQQQVSAFPQSVAMGLLLYGAQHNSCDIAPEIKLPTVKHSEPTPVENHGGDMGFNFNDTNANDGKEEREVYLAPKVDTTPIPEKDDTPEVPIVVTPTTETIPPVTDHAEEKVDEHVEDATPTHEEQEEQQPAQPAKPKKPGFGARLRGFVDQFRNRVDDMFTGDDLL